MTSDPRLLRDQAGALRHGADRLTLLRLRLATVIVETTRAEDVRVRRIGGGIHEQWSRREYVELGRLATSLRGAAKLLDAVAVEGERTSGRRLGGYSGAGFLGRGDDAHLHVGAVSGFVGTTHGASIGGFPLVPGLAGAEPVHPSHTLGIATPDYDDED
ncbi:hypothetical protein ACTXJK_03795 [Brachybacterium tyrofermentans]|uniref:hypothetical protein n=1 Tax=Brachybacterium tyrofermentans TaxID=47848 RepID=UPI003FD57594